MALQPGEIIDGKYRIVRLIGEGGMGAVYEGENTRIKRTVAIKVLHAAVAEKTDVVQRFEREAQAAGRIGSEHIVEVLDLGNLPSGERYMVMEFLAGEDLTSRIKRRRRLQPQEAIPLVHQVLEGLHAAHQTGIIHRDLKPDNIYILSNRAGRSDFVKILDFGVSKFSALDNEMSMTRTGAVMGTPYYMSPEQAKGGNIDQRSDLYAIGVVLYQAVTGRVPFNASSFNELLFKIALESPEPVEAIVPDCPPSFVALINKAMARDPAQRFQSAREFQQALSAWQATAAPLPGAPPGRPAGFGEATVPLPAMPDLRPPMQTGPSLPGAGGYPTPSSEVALRQTGPSHPGLTATPIPGTNSGLGVSQSALAVTPQPKPKKGGVVVALVAVSVAILGAGAFGAYLLTRTPEVDAAPAGSTEPDDGPVEVPAGEGDDAPSDDGDDDPTPVASEEPPDDPPDPPDASQKPATPVPVTTTVPQPVPRPQPQPKAQPKQPEPKQPPPPPPPGGRNIKTEL